MGHVTPTTHVTRGRPVNPAFAEPLRLGAIAAGGAPGVSGQKVSCARGNMRAVDTSALPGWTVIA